MTERKTRQRAPQCHIPTVEVELPLTVPPSFRETLEAYELALEAIRPLEDKWAGFFELADEPEAEE